MTIQERAKELYPEPTHPKFNTGNVMLREAYELGAKEWQGHVEWKPISEMMFKGGICWLSDGNEAVRGFIDVFDDCYTECTIMLNFTPTKYAEIITPKP